MVKGETGNEKNGLGFDIEGQRLPESKDIKIPVDKPMLEPIEEEKKKRKRRKTKKKGVELSDIKIPLALLVLSLTEAIGGKWTATEKEAVDIENGFNTWVELRLPILQKFAPELVLLIPIGNYLFPRTFRKPIPEEKKTKIEKDKKD